LRFYTQSIPAVCELGAHCLQVRVAHVLDCEDEDMLKVVRGFLDIGEKLLRQLLALLVRLGKMYDLLALRFRHVGGFGVVVVRSYRAQEKSSKFQKISGEFLANHRTWQPRLKLRAADPSSLSTLLMQSTMLRR
jgi:hypothetical protein